MAMPSRIAFLLLGLASLAACTAPPPSSSATSSQPPDFGAPIVTAAPGADLPTPESYRLLPGELQLAASPGDIPAILADASLFVDAEQGSLEWHPDEGVVGVEFGGEARAYPIRLLSQHEIVNDTVGGQPLAVTWCPLCYSALVFDRVLDRELTFGASGYLLRNNLVMYDHQSNSLWSQLLAQGIRGAYRGERLRILPAVHTTWGAWKTGHPDTLVLSATRLGKQAAEVIDPYAAYYQSQSAGLGGGGEVDPRLPAKTLVVGVHIGDQAAAYPFERLKSIGVLNTELAGVPIVVVYNRALNSAWVFDRRLGIETLSFIIGDDPDTLIEAETPSVWDAKTGEALQGQPGGLMLRPVPSTLVFWFAWSGLYPETALYLEGPSGE